MAIDGRSERRLLLVVGDLSVGGTENHIVRVYPELVKRGLPTEIFALLQPGHLAPRARGAGVSVISPWNDGVYAKAPGPLKGLMLVWSALCLAWHMRARRPLAVHFYLPLPYLVGALCGLVTGTRPMIMSRRNLNNYQAKYPRLTKLEKRLHGHMTAVSANSQAIGRELLQEGIPEEKLVVIHNGVEPPSSDAATAAEERQRLGLPPETLIFVIVANLMAYKGHADLLEALAFAAPRIDKPWHLVCVGRDRGALAELRERAERLGIAKRVTFTGQKDQVQPFFEMADVALLCSHEEGFSNSILEAMAAGVPLIVSDVGGNPEAVADGVNGLVYPPGDATQLAEALVRLATNDELRREMGRHSRERFEEHFTLDLCIEAHVRFYERLTGLALR